ncbi:LacI family DNA-binding transcriptional regulator [Luteimicrobium xylanilyticum]|uniref:Sucrose operon repressor n=1 Tax=Luteimicrobium xylanilyticum TaxID=1133546 RepID=A0A5P9Q7S7_9MICO|nr:LacI family DNA-binding transcriptional regulator [Luteimicrobium xylanilyticum]QFU97140.1 Sucrose operon repressor [Luteimicrobium xylanilyticum]
MVALTSAGDAQARRRPPSMAEVAALAGVSAQTVSRVANGRTNVEQATRERVLAAMGTLGYRPNRAARALRSGRSRSIGVLVYTLTSYGSTRTVNGIALEAAKAGYSVTLIPLASPEPADVSAAFETLAEQSVDGAAILLEVQRMTAAEIVLPTDLPVVVVDSGPPTRYPAIDNDQARGARLATEHLLGLGHRNVWHIAGPQASHSAEVRRTTWEKTLRDAGAPVPEVQRGDWSPEAGYAIGSRLAEDPAVTAVFAANDQMALGVLRALHDAGRDVPGDVSVVGFDDMPESASFQPPLTTIHQHFDRIGVECVSALLEEIENGERQDHALVPVELVVRASTAPPA